jgi:DnaJ-class molecular chaperone
MEKSDLIEDVCPRCQGTGADPEQPSSPRQLPDDPKLPGEAVFQVSADPCRACGGSGRIQKAK